MEQTQSYRFGDFRIDPAERLLYHRDEPVAITPKAFETLLVLAERHGHIVGKTELMELVWPEAHVEENNLAQNISILRKALGSQAAGRPYIETISRRGYRFTANVTPVEPQTAHPPAPISPKVR